MNPSPTADDTRGSALGEDRGHPTTDPSTTRTGAPAASPSAPAPGAGTGPPVTAAAARAAVCELLDAAGVGLDTVTAADALLITSELVTNALRHGDGLTHFRPEIRDGALHLAVGDNNPRGPVLRDQDTVGHVGGYGWALVRRLAAHVDVSGHGGGKTITTVLPLV
ncbi:ATP-binding protein [Streptomyces subrutilus]|uniref:ATP-binding protein n=1 Tax=Streptomyces subrutilus TaxID=36818 RepID=UPI0034012DA6